MKAEKFEKLLKDSGGYNLWRHHFDDLSKRQRTIAFENAFKDGMTYELLMRNSWLTNEQIDRCWSARFGTYGIRDRDEIKDYIGDSKRRKRYYEDTENVSTNLLIKRRIIITGIILIGIILIGIILIII